MTLENRVVDLATAIGNDIKTLSQEIIDRTNTFVFTQAIPSSVWVINHGLSKNPSVTVVDSAGSIVEGGVQYISVNEIEITFIGAFSGKAYLN